MELSLAQILVAVAFIQLGSCDHSVVDGRSGEGFPGNSCCTRVTQTWAILSFRSSWKRWDDCGVANKKWALTFPGPEWQRWVTAHWAVSHQQWKSLAAPISVNAD